MKSVLISIKPYWVFLIIAKIMGWNIDKKKTIEVRKTYPKDSDWNKIGKIYCTKDKQSFERIPEEYQPLMERYLGKVIGEFVCDYIYENMSYDCKDSCVSVSDLQKYANSKPLYGWHISELKIYDEPKELGEFKKAGFLTEEEWLFALYPNTHCHYEAWAKKFEITRPPQSWYYVEEVKEMTCKDCHRGTVKWLNKEAEENEQIY